MDKNGVEVFDIRVLVGHLDHTVTLSLNPNAGEGTLLQRFLSMVDDLTRICTDGGALFREKPASLDMDVSKAHFGREKFLKEFPAFCILVIELSDGTEIAFAIAKSDLYLFAYRRNDIWYNLQGASCKIKGGVEASFDVSYQSSSDDTKPVAVSIETIENAIRILNGDRNWAKRESFHHICLVIAESLRFHSIFSIVRRAVEQGTREIVSGKSLSAINNWKDLSSLWIQSLYAKSPISVKFSLLKVVDSVTEQEIDDLRETKNVKGALDHLQTWIRQNVRIVRGERLKDRKERSSNTLDKNYHPFLRKLRPKQLNNEVERQEFWAAVLEDPLERNRDVWRILHKATRFMLSEDPHGVIKAQLLTDNSELIVKRTDLSFTQFKNRNGTLVDFIIPVNIVTLPPCFW